MRLYVTTEHRFGRRSDGELVSLTGGRGYGFWQRYLQAFETVVVVGRVDPVPKDYSGLETATGAGVEFLAIPNYKGLMQFFLSVPAIVRGILGIELEDSAFLLRVPGLLGVILALLLKWRKIAYAVEVVGDPAGVYAEGATRHRMRSAIQKVSVAALQWQCAGATAASYVTSQTLQVSYPAREGAYTTHYSSVELPDDAFVAGCGPKDHLGQALPNIVTVGSLEQPYKGVDVLLEAVASLRKRGFDVKLRIVGDGAYRAGLETQARRLDISDLVTFVGRLSTEGVRRELDDADVFVLASRTEGLPRAMIEAMARGLPCIGTRVGGIPELLPDECLVSPDNSQELAQKMEWLLQDSQAMADHSGRNLRKASEYHADILQQRRTVFYRELRRRSEQRFYRH